MRTIAAWSALLLAGVLLVFPRLDDRYLWEDEAETALLARNVIRFGVPVAWDGRDLISQECRTEVGTNYLWRHTPWLPMYLMAASFALLGVGTLAARLPFAVLGIFTLASLVVVARAVFRDRATEFLAGWVLVLSVPFLLHVRQGRYYAVAILATAWLVGFLFWTLDGHRFAPIGIVAALTLLFHANYLMAVATATGAAASLVVLRPDRRALGRIAAAGVGAVLLNAPWFVVFGLGSKAGFVLDHLSGRAVVERFVRYLSGVERYAFPALVLGPAALVAIRWRRRAVVPDASGTRAVGALALLGVGHLLVLSLSPLPFYRYFMNLLPVFALIIAWIVRSLAVRSVALAALVLVAVVGVDHADAAAGRLGSPLVKYVDEITHDFHGPVEVLAKYLQHAAAPGERVFASYGALGLRFYTSLNVRGGGACQGLADWPPPDWIVVRYFFRLNPVAPAAKLDEQETVRALNRYLGSGQYRHLVIGGVDTVHDSIPEPDVHLFREPRTGPPLTIFHRVRPSAATAAGG